MDSLIDFKKYFNRNFWNAFSNKNIFIDSPSTPKNKDKFIVETYNEIVQKAYYPSLPQLYLDINKGKGVTRIIPVFSLKDYCIYYYCIKKLESKLAFNRVNNTFGGWTLGGLFRKSEKDEMEKRKKDFDKFEEFMSELNGISVTQYSFNPQAWAKAYGDLNAKLYATSKERKYKFVVELDISNFYDSIRLDILEHRVREVFDEKFSDTISLLFLFLNYWNRKINSNNRQIVGIPQDALGDCSRILANFYLQPYDHFVSETCKKMGGKYLRYSDDQFIFSNNQNDLEQMVYLISKKLNSMGLFVNQKKVRFFSTAELTEYRSFNLFDLLKTKKDRNDKVKVEKFVDKYLDLLDNNHLVNLKNDGKPLLTRALFSPAIKKIDAGKKNMIVKSLLDENYLAACKSKHLELIYNLLSNREKKVFIIRLKKLTEKFMHNSFHYEVLDFFDKNQIKNRTIKWRLRKITSQFDF
jgi:uncharacterized protein YfkK (UPF0435 family)